MLHYENLELYLRLGLKLKTIHRWPITIVKTIYWIQHTKGKEAGKNNDKDGKAFYELMNNAISGKNNGKLEK